MTGSGLSCELFVNHLGNFLFYLEIPTCSITGAEPAYHRGIMVELTSNFNCVHAARYAWDCGCFSTRQGFFQTSGIEMNVAD